VADPGIEHPRDAIIKVTSCAICGSDRHLYDGFMPGSNPATSWATSSMPSTRISDSEAREIAAHLYALRSRP
jgi:threonine dehydrogenase-like Zn-dependent dehydrogenase